MEMTNRLLAIEEAGPFYILRTDGARVKLYFLTDEIIRVRAAFDGDFKEESYVLMTTAWEDRLDSLFEGERTRIDPVKPTVTESEEEVVFATEALKLAVKRDPFELKLTDAEGDVLYQTTGLTAYTKDSNNRRTAYSCMKDDDCFYGFGEKTGPLNKNKSFIRERATDCMGYDPERADTLYKHIPFYIKLDRDNGKAVGVYYHNFHEAEFNMGCEKSNYWPAYSYYRTDGGDLDLFVIGGSRISKIVDNYTCLTGRPCLLPKRALGYQGSSMYYSELPADCDEAIARFVDTVRAEGIPIDGFHLSSGYTNTEGRRHVFTWNSKKFDDPKAYFQLLNEMGAENVPNVKPGVLTDHPMMNLFKDNDVFIKDSKDSSKDAACKWWGGEGRYFDFTNPKARDLWKKLLKENLISLGVNSIWNDNCEYDGLLDQDAIVDFDGQKGTIGQLKPVMANLMCRLSNEAVIEHNENARPYSVCRAGTAGIQKYAQTWCGDNYSSWKTLKANVATILGMGLSGQPNEGADIGGFAGPAPGKELFIRWVQQGVFQPRFSIHSASTDNTVTEPWMYPDAADLIRGLILFRYRFLPYLYSVEYEASQTGAPIMRPLVYEFQDDPNVYDNCEEYMFGRNILVANVLEEGQTKKSVYLPKGQKWYALTDDLREYEGGTTVEIPVDIKSVPIFLRQGGIVPVADNQIMNMASDPVSMLHLYLAPGADSSFTMYDDDGCSNDYKKGVYKKTNISMHGKSVVEVDISYEGSYNNTIEGILAEMVCKEKSPLKVEVLSADKINRVELPRYLNQVLYDENDAGWYYNLSTGSVMIKYPNPKSDYTLRVSFEAFDLVGM